MRIPVNRNKEIEYDRNEAIFAYSNDVNDVS